MLRVIFEWTEGCQHPSGGRDIEDTKNYELLRFFEARSIAEARDKAKIFVAEAAKNKVPQEKKGSLSWSSAPQIVTQFLGFSIGFD